MKVPGLRVSGTDQKECEKEEGCHHGVAWDCECLAMRASLLE